MYVRIGNHDDIGVPPRCLGNHTLQITIHLQYPSSQEQLPYETFRNHGPHTHITS